MFQHSLKLYEIVKLLSRGVSVFLIVSAFAETGGIPKHSSISKQGGEWRDDKNLKSWFYLLIPQLHLSGLELRQRQRSLCEFYILNELGYQLLAKVYKS
jgi:hypothetical protein